MRRDLTISRKRQLEAERLAALGRAAGFISHDLRHHLGAVIANAEFLHDPEEVGADRDEIYREVLQASSRMTGLLDALLEIAQEEKSLTVSDADLGDIIERAVSAVKANPQFHARLIEVHSDGETIGRFDAQKLERVFFNLLLNSCEATNENKGQIGVTIANGDLTFECRVSDTGSGIPPEIRDVLFEPFVSAGKNNGTGLGLAIAAKIIHDHGGNIQVAETSPAGTTIVVTVPRNRATAGETSSASVQRAPAKSSPSADEVLP
jgi:signal transduction histidine kinase